MIFDSYIHPLCIPLQPIPDSYHHVPLPSPSPPITLQPPSQTHLRLKLPPHHLRRRIRPPRLKARTLRQLQIERDLSLTCMFRDGRRRIRFLRGRRVVHGVAKGGGRVGGRKRRLIRLDALGAQEGVGPVRAVDVGAVGDGELGEGSGGDGGGAVVAGMSIVSRLLAEGVGVGVGVGRECTDSRLRIGDHLCMRVRWWAEKI